MGDGVLSLRFARDRHGRTRLAARQQRYPLTTTAVLPMESESGALIYVQNAAGSVFGGDRLHVAVHLEASAELCLSTPSATRLQGEALSIQTTMIEAERRSLLRVHPGYDNPACASGTQAAHMYCTGKRSRGHFHGEFRGWPGGERRGAPFIEASRRAFKSVLAHALCLLTLRVSVLGRRSPALEGALASSGFVGTIFALSQQGDHEELATLISRRLASLPGVYGGAAALASGYGGGGTFSS